MKIRQMQNKEDAEKHLRNILSYQNCINILGQLLKKKSFNGHPVKWFDVFVEVQEGDCLRAFIDRIYSDNSTFQIQPKRVFD